MMNHRDRTTIATGQSTISGTPFLLDNLERRSLFSATHDAGDLSHASDDESRSAIHESAAHESTSQQDSSNKASDEQAAPLPTENRAVVQSEPKVNSAARNNEEHDEGDQRVGATKSATSSDDSKADDSHESSASPPKSVSGNQGSTESNEDASKTGTDTEARPYTASEEPSTGSESAGTSQGQDAGSAAPVTVTEANRDTQENESRETSAPSVPSAREPKAPELSDTGRDAASSDLATIDATITAVAGAGQPGAAIDAAIPIGFTDRPLTYVAAASGLQLAVSASKLFAGLQAITSQLPSAAAAISAIVTPAVGAVDKPVEGLFSAQRIFHFARIGDPALMLSDALAAFVDDSTSLSGTEKRFQWQRAAIVTGVVVLGDTYILLHLQKRKRGTQKVLNWSITANNRRAAVPSS